MKRYLVLAVVALAIPGAAMADATLVVVQDLGGTSALPHYRALGLKVDESERPATAATTPVAPTTPYKESDFLPVRSTRLKPGTVVPRALNLPALTPMFLIGADSASRAWLREHAKKLRNLRALGWVVNVESSEALQALRELAPDLKMVPASGDDIASRLKVDHYPVLITPTGIEQ